MSTEPVAAWGQASLARSLAIQLRVIRALMLRHGFVGYPYEFWHFSSGDAYEQVLRQTGQPARYGAVSWDPQTQQVTPLAQPDAALNSVEEIRQEIAAALARLG